MLLNCGTGEDTWESFEQQGTVNPKGNLFLIFIGKTDAEVPILLPPHVKSQLVGKDSEARKDWRQKEKGEVEDEMVRQYHQLNGHEFEETPGAQKIRHNLATEQ